MMVLRLNLGCGFDKRPREEGWCNIDKQKHVEPDLLLDLETQQLPYADNSVDEIFAKDILEHFSHIQVPTILKDWFRVLKLGGKLYIQSPDLDTICHYILTGRLWNWKQISYWLYGEQNIPENVHKCGFTIPTLTALLYQIGFKVTEANKGGTNLMIWAVKP